MNVLERSVFFLTLFLTFSFSSPFAISVPVEASHPLSYNELTANLRIEKRERIKLIGDADFAIRTKRALDYIAKNDLSLYDLTLSNISSIKQDGAKTGINLETRQLSIRRYSYENTTPIYASMIVHDAVHGRLKSMRFIPVGENAEFTCLVIQDDFLKKTGNVGIDINDKMNTKYWEVEENQRWW